MPVCGRRSSERAGNRNIGPDDARLGFGFRKLRIQALKGRASPSPPSSILDGDRKKTCLSDLVGPRHAIRAYTRRDRASSAMKGWVVSTNPNSP